MSSMTPDAIGILSVGIATGALFVAGLHAVRDVLLGRAGGHAERRGVSSRHAGTAHADGRAAAFPGSGQRGGGADQGGAGQSSRQERHETPGAPGNTYDPRPHEDRARRRMAFLLFALLAAMVVALLAMVAFGIISVSEVKEFGVIIAALVPLVTVTIAYYFKSKDGSKK